MSDYDKYPVSLPGFELIEPELVQHVTAIETEVSRYTSYVYFRNHHDVIEGSWQRLCDGFEEAFPDNVSNVDGDLRQRVSEIGFVGHYENKQETLEVSPIELLLRMGDRLIPEASDEHDRLFAHLLSSYVDSRSRFSPDPSGTEPRSAIRFQTARTAHRHLEQFRRSGQSNRYVHRLERVLALADLNYHPVASRARKLGGSLLEKVSDAIDL